MQQQDKTGEYPDLLKRVYQLEYDLIQANKKVSDLEIELNVIRKLKFPQNDLQLEGLNDKIEAIGGALLELIGDLIGESKGPLKTFPLSRKVKIIRQNRQTLDRPQGDDDKETCH